MTPLETARILAHVERNAKADINISPVDALAICDLVRELVRLGDLGNTLAHPQICDGYAPGAEPCDCGYSKWRALADAADEADALLAENVRLKEELAEAKKELVCEWVIREEDDRLYGTQCGTRIGRGHYSWIRHCPDCGGKVVVK